MAYFVQADLTYTIGADLVLRLLDDDNDGTVDAATLAALQDRVRDEFRGYLSRLYDLSELEADPPGSVKMLACELAVEFAYRRRPELANERGETPWTARYKDALRRLAELRDGKWRLDIDGENPAAPANVGGGVYQGITDDYPDGIGGGIFSTGWGDF